MFERFVALAKARRALAEGLWEQAVQLTDDPMVRSHRRAEEIRRKAMRNLLERARQRMQRGELGHALGDASRVLVWDPECVEARELVEELKRRLQGERERGDAAREMIGQARKAAEQGQLGVADELARAAAELGSGAAAAEHADLERFLDQRRQRAAAALRAAQDSFEAGDTREAVAELRRARLLDDRVAGGSSLPDKLAAVVGRDLAKAMRGLLREGRPEDAVDALLEARRGLPEIERVDAVRAALERSEAALRALVRQRLGEGDPVRAARELLARAAVFDEARWEGLGQGLRAVLRGDDLRQRGSLVAAAQAFEQAQQALQAPALAALARGLARDARRIDEVIGKARGLAERGDLTGARAALTEVLAEWPMHEQVRAELEVLDQGASDREQRLAGARDLAKEGRLRAAKAQVLALVGPDQAGEEARLLLQDLQARLDLVGRGLDEVRSSLHGRTGASAEGIRHCLSRLDELAKVCSDHDELPVLRQALQGELRGLELYEVAEAALRRSEFQTAGEAARDLVALRSKLLHEDRLDARILALADRLLEGAEEAVEAGRLRQVEACLCGVRAAAAVRPELGQRAADLEQRAAGRRQRAEALAASGLQALQQRDLATAADRLDAARELHLEGPAVRRLAGELNRLCGQEGALARVEELARERDFAGAQRELADLPPTPPALRTRIFDMKQNLARIQGLDGGFLLRVDEGGEFLVLRGDSITIGNVREGKTDLPILANIAGRHARIQRSLSFHGGMEDRILAEGGEVRVAGRAVREHRLADGDRIELGPSLKLEYHLPSRRSLTAGLRLLGGFQVGGTDRVFLMKDRGRDGRILIGGGRDAHVRVPDTEDEVEIFANRNGQIRVRFEGDGTMDGKPFSGEHPIEAGATVQCGRLTFVLLPWNGGL